MAAVISGTLPRSLLSALKRRRGYSSQNPDFANIIRHEGHKGRNKRVIHSKRAKKDKKPYEAPKKDGSSSSKGPLCYHYEDTDHERKECKKFKQWSIKKGNGDKISIVDESFYALFPLSIWWIDSGVTIHVTNSS
jgi:hypothetical protein